MLEMLVHITIAAVVVGHSFDDVSYQVLLYLSFPHSCLLTLHHCRLQRQVSPHALFDAKGPDASTSYTRLYIHTPG